MKRTAVKCKPCNGTGRISLGADMQKTLDNVVQHGPISAPGLYAFMRDPSITVTAVKNRLEKLRKFKLVQGTKEQPTFGRPATLYAAVKQPLPPTVTVASLLSKVKP